MATQLRRYTINRGKMEEFVRAWAEGVVPLRRRHGFRVEGAWVIRERNEFLWLLASDAEDWEAEDAAYYASPERAALDPDPAQHIAQVEHWFVEPVRLSD